MYVRVREKIMSEARISRACANFLSDVDLKPGYAQSGGGMNANCRHQVRFVDSMNRVQSVCNVDVRTRGLVAGSLTHARPAELAVLDLECQWWRYREHLTGVSPLTLFDAALPEQLCAGLPRDKYRLCEIVDFSSYKPWFFIRADPRVRSIRNVVRMRTIEYMKRAPRSGLLITMVDDWSHANWRYWSFEHGYQDQMA
ncbi:hypothetical protein [Sphingomonas sp. TX0522]|jgi:hypothetical protein|uniref:hypothetical protein n=1 Tax=Sphingomonas sp. TX0522 TaxID=2479205 RepID=UPI0018DF5B20|nr:hypothetical protein [Sphingomonas sp. TX0522]MBI0532058.1 hypothetical protein [Sphingomonas sp. TX0522]